MKKYAIAIIGLIFASLVLGSCDIKTGGTIVVVNGYNSPMVFAVGKIFPSLDNLEAVEAGGSKSFSFDDDGLYTVAYAAVSDKLNIKSKTEYLSGGETKRVTIGP